VDAKGSSARPNTSYGAGRKVHDTRERRIIFSDAFDAAIHCMTLSYEHPDEQVRQLLATEALVWSNFVVADAIRSLGSMNR
jgi:hypothetical protein